MAKREKPGQAVVDEAEQAATPARAPEPEAAPEVPESEPVIILEPDPELSPEPAMEPEPATTALEPEAQAPEEHVQKENRPQRPACPKCSSTACGVAGGMRCCNQCGHRWS